MGWLALIQNLLGIFNQVSSYLLNKQQQKAGKAIEKADQLELEMEAIKDAKETDADVANMSDADKRKWMREHLQR